LNSDLYYSLDTDCHCAALPFDDRALAHASSVTYRTCTTYSK
jgi:hypothetical protein